MDKLSLEQLQQLLENETKLVDFIAEQNRRTADGSENVLEDLKSSNYQQATKNLNEYERKLQELYKELGALQSEHETEQSSYKTLLQTYTRETQKYNRDRLMERMQEACQESDAASERFVETFLSDTSGAAVDQFIKQYRDMRRLYYIRQAKLDRIQ